MHIILMHATPTFLTEVLYLVTYVQLFNDSYTVKVTAYTVPAYPY